MTIQIKYYPHGTTFDNEAGIATGQADANLSDLGETQVHNLAEHELKEVFDVVFCSDLKRALRTAEVVFGDRFKIEIDKRLREIDVGDVTRKSDVEDVNPFKKSCIEKPFPNGESYKQVEERTREFLQDLKLNNYKRVAIIGHQSTQLAFEVLLKNKTWEEALDSDWRLTKSWQPGWEYELK